MQTNEAIRKILEIHQDELVRLSNLQQDQVALIGSMKEALTTTITQVSAEVDILSRLLLTFLDLLVRLGTMSQEMPDSLVSSILSGTDPETRRHAVRVVELLEAWASDGSR